MNSTLTPVRSEERPLFGLNAIAIMSTVRSETTVADHPFSSIYRLFRIGAFRIRHFLVVGGQLKNQLLCFRRQGISLQITLS